MSSAPFELVDTRRIDSLNIEFQSYRHRGTGARHFHLSAEDTNNAFAVAFLTVPSDSTGVAHILEHTALCGSARFPVRDPFFNMLKRSLNTFMNAFTAADWTAYPFASQNRKDFDNLLQVYLDAAFFPHLSALDFAQEGHRLEPEDRSDPDTALVLKGVVYNEMKGAMSPPVSQVHQALQAELFPTITYHHNSGGDPEQIPDLSHAQLLAFHARHYHPSNAVFMTYGDFPVAEHHARIHELALARFEAADTSALRVPDERRYQAPRQITGEFAVEQDAQLADGAHVLVGWLLRHSADPRETLRAHLLNGVLMEHSGSPLRAALETSTLGTAPSELCGLDDSTREATFCVGLEGADPARASEVEALILGVLEQVASQGVPAEEVASTLHQLELSQREVGGDHFPYGLGLMLRALSPALHGGDPVAALDIDVELERLREEARAPDFVPGLVRELLLDNPHRVRLTMTPSVELTRTREERLRERLRAIRAGLSDAARARLSEQAAALEALQDAEVNADVLPKVGIEDVPPDLTIPEGVDSTIAGMPACHYEAGTNGLVYARLVSVLPELDAELRDILPLYCDLVTEVGAAERDYRANQSWQASVVGGLSSSTSLRGRVDAPAQPEGHVVLAGKALGRNQAQLAALLRETLATPRFDEPARVRELVAQIRAQEESRLTDIGHNLALLAANDGLTATGTINEAWSGLSAVAALRRLDETLADPAAITGLCAKLTRIGAAVASAPRRVLAVSEGSARAPFLAALEEAFQGLAPMTGVAATLDQTAAATPDLAWVINSQVNFAAKVYRTVAQTHEDAAALFVLCNMLRTGFLHRELREKGGAYGGGASYDTNTGTLGFYSYRDPRLADTLADFDRALDWAMDTAGDGAEREQAILGVIAAMDRPGSPAGEAIGAYMATLHGRTPALRRSLRARILDVDAGALRGVVERYLQGQKARIAVVTNQNALDTDADRLSLEPRSL